MWLIVLSDQLPIVALVGSYPTNQLIGHRPIPQRLATLLSRLHPRKPMRSCRRFLAGIPHCGVGHPCVTHPSATPSGSEKPQGVRLACVRHAASVYPEPGSNSPSMFYIQVSQRRLKCSVSELSPIDRLKKVLHYYCSLPLFSCSGTLDASASGALHQFPDERK